MESAEAFSDSVSTEIDYIGKFYFFLSDFHLSN